MLLLNEGILPCTSFLNDSCFLQGFIRSQAKGLSVVQVCFQFFQTSTCALHCGCFSGLSSSMYVQRRFSMLIMWMLCAHFTTTFSRWHFLCYRNTSQPSLIAPSFLLNLSLWCHSVLHAQPWRCGAVCSAVLSTSHCCKKSKTNGLCRSLWNNLLNPVCFMCYCRCTVM